MALTRPAGTWKYEDLFTLADDGTRCEIIDGDLYEMPAPRSAHVVAIFALIRLLLPLIDRLGATILTAPLDIFFTGANPVEPDLVVFVPHGRARLVGRGVEGPPDLLIEVLNPSHRSSATSPPTPPRFSPPTLKTEGQAQARLFLDHPPSRRQSTAQPPMSS